MTWGHPELLALLLLGPVVLVGGVLAWRARRRALAKLASVPTLASLIPPGAARARAWQAVLAVIAVVAAAFAAAGPQLGFDWEQRRMEGVSIVVALDVSRSMDAQDVSPSRLERARREIEDLTRMLRGDAVGLVLFAQGAWVRIPLTTDYGTFLWAVKDSTTQTIQAQGTALSGAIDAGTKMLARAPGTGKALIVVSDGEDHEKDEVIDAVVGRAIDAGVHIFVIGVGDTAGAPIPLADGGFKKDRSGNVVLSKLDEDRLNALAQATGGAYVRSVVSDDDVRGIYEGEIRGKMEAAERGVRRDKRPRERFQWPLGVAAVAMVLSAGLGIGPRRARAALLLLGLGLAAPLPAHAGVRDDGMAAYKAEKWDDAVRELGQARVADPSDREVGQALATSLYRAGRYREAEQIFDALAASAPSPQERAIHQFNAGNAAYRGGRLQEALHDFEAAKKEAPELAAAAKNAEAVSREIQARLQSPPPQPPQGQDGQADDSQSGQSGEGQGQQQAGQEGDQQQAGESGQQQGDQQQAGQQGDPRQGGQQGQQAQQQPGQQGGQPQGQPGQAPPTDGTRDPSQAGDAQAAGEPGEEGEPGASMAQGEPGDAGSSDMTADQAARLVDAVPDGKPQVQIAGQTSGEDW